MWWVISGVESICYLQPVSWTDVTFPKVGWWEITRAVVPLCTNHSFPPPLLLPLPHLSTPFLPLCPTISPSLSSSLSDVCSQIPSSGIRCRRSGKSSLGGTGWRKTSRRRFPPVSLHTRRSPSLNVARAEICLDDTDIKICSTDSPCAMYACLELHCKMSCPTFEKRRSDVYWTFDFKCLCKNTPDSCITPKVGFQ